MINKTITDDNIDVYNFQMKLMLNTTGKLAQDWYTTKWVIWYQRRKSDWVGNENEKVYGLYYIRKFKEDEWLCLYMGELVHYDANAKEEHACSMMRAGRYKVCMGMYYIKGPIFYWYASKYEDNGTTMHVIEKLKKKHMQKNNKFYERLVGSGSSNKKN